MLKVLIAISVACFAAVVLIAILEPKAAQAASVQRVEVSLDYETKNLLRRIAAGVEKCNSKKE
jgi:nucleoside permease NupC